MADHKDAKRKQLEEIETRLADVRNRIEAAVAEMDHASELIDGEAYLQAKHKREVAASEAEMLEKRYRVIELKKMLSQEASDEIIDGLLLYEARLSDDFRHAIITPLARVKKLLDTYLSEVAAVEEIMNRWGYDIRPNFRVGLGIKDGKAVWSSLSERPVAIHNIAFRGCPEALILEELLNRSRFKK